MILLTAGQTAEGIIVTLNEKKTISSPYYLFVFTHITTKDVVKKIINSADDESSYPERFNQFTIDTSAVFLNSKVGEWNYNVYEQESDSNTDTDGLNEVEQGIMKLQPADNFEYEQYEPTTSYKTYGG